MQRPFRHLAWIALLLGVGPVPAALATAPVVERSDIVAESRGLTGLTVDNSRGRTEIRPSADGRIHVTAVKLCRAAREDEARSVAAQISVETATVGARYVVSVHYPRRLDVHIDFWDLFKRHDDSGPLVPQAEVRLAIEVPRAFQVEVSSVSGDLATDNLAGTQRLHTTSGDIAATSGAGWLDIGSVSGDVRLEAIAGAHVHTVSGDLEAHDPGVLRFESTSGDARVDGARDSLRLNSTSGDLSISGAPRGLEAGTTSGNIELTAGSGRIQLGSQSGDLTAQVRGPLSSASLSTSSGDVQVDLAPGLEAALDLSTVSGEMSCSLPVQLLEHARTRLRASVGRGGPLVRLKSISGSLNVTSGGK